MEIITGKAAQAHVTAAQHRSIIEAVAGGGGSYIPPNVLDGLSATLDTTNNKVQVSSGLLFHHGAVFQSDGGTDDAITYDNGTVGYNRIDLIYVRYSKNASTAVETGTWGIKKGTQTTGTATVPTLDYGDKDLRDGDLNDDCAVFKLTFTGLTPVLTPLLVTNPHGAVGNLSNTIGMRGWNQLVKSSDTSVTLTSGHKYVTRISGTDSYVTGTGQSITVTGSTDNVFDLTAMFGSGNEPTTVSDFRSMFSADYYPFYSGSNMDLLWTNASPTSAFSGQTISLDFSNYEGALIVFKLHKDSTVYFDKTVLFKNATYMASNSAGDSLSNYISIVMRKLYISNSGAVFQSGYFYSYNASGQTNNNCAIPYQIYGIRG